MLLTTGGGCSTNGPRRIIVRTAASAFTGRSFLFSGQGLFDTVPCSSTDSSQGGGFSRCKGGRYECQERKESTSLTSLFATDATHGPSPSSTFGRHDVFETMKGTRCRHVLFRLFSVCPRLGWPPPLTLSAALPAAAPPPPPPLGILGAKRGHRPPRTLDASDTRTH